MCEKLSVLGCRGQGRLTSKLSRRHHNAARARVVTKDWRREGRGSCASQEPLPTDGDLWARPLRPSARSYDVVGFSALLGGPEAWCGAQEEGCSLCWVLLSGRRWLGSQRLLRVSRWAIILYYAATLRLEARSSSRI